MKFLLIISLSMLLFAKSIDSCYSVQLKSFKIRSVSSYSFEREMYPRECKLMKFSRMYAVRCGCYDFYNQAQRAQQKYFNQYDDALIVLTYRKRFAGMKLVQEPIEKKIHADDNSEYENIKIDSFSENGRYDDDDGGDADSLESYGYR